MLTRFRAFLRDCDGAVTIDWVVLTAGIVAMAIFIISPYGLAPTGFADTLFGNAAEATTAFFEDD